jgi:hypothetical protein
VFVPWQEEVWGRIDDALDPQKKKEEAFGGQVDDVLVPWVEELWIDDVLDPQEKQKEEEEAFGVKVDDVLVPREVAASLDEVVGAVLAPMSSTYYLVDQLPSCLHDIQTHGCEYCPVR